MHTIGFDGQDTVRDMVDRAKELGFDTIGISNHFIVNPIIKSTRMYHYSVIGGYSNIYSDSFDVVTAKFIQHYDEIAKIQSENKKIKILRGMEVDFFNDVKWRDGFERCLAILKPDYLIGSCHLIEYDNTLLNSHDWKNADTITQDVLLKKYWTNIINAAQSGIFTWMAHLDLPKKVSLGLDEKWAAYENRAMDAIRKSGVAMEINTSFYKSGINEPYPSERILNMAHDVPVLISDDAHAAKQIGRYFDNACDLLNKYKLSQFQFEK